MGEDRIGVYIREGVGGEGGGGGGGVGGGGGGGGGGGALTPSPFWLIKSLFFFSGLSFTKRVHYIIVCETQPCSDLCISIQFSF